MPTYPDCDDYHFRLNTQLWPIHLKPKPDELLSSWIIRLAHAHGYKSQTMCVFLFGRQEPIWNRDIDRLASPEIGDKLMAATGATLQQFENTTFKGYEGWLYQSHQPNGMTRWIIPIGIYHRTRRRPGLAFCPKCLAEDAEPYFRRQWRLAFSTVCTKHRCHLLDACPSCQSPVILHRTDMQSKDFFPTEGLLVHCWKCGFKLSQSHTEEESHIQLIDFQFRLEKVLKQGFVSWAGNPSMHSVMFFQGLRDMIAGFISKVSLQRLRRSSILDDIDLSGWVKSGLEMSPIGTRRAMFLFLARLLEEWPDSFTNHIRKCDLRYSDLRGDTDYRPFWYEDVIRRESLGGFAKISQLEAESIAAATEKLNGQFSLKRSRELFGRDIAMHVPDRLPKPISEDTYEDLLTSIDHQIAGTQDEIKRFSLIRDKIMFATGRQLHLSQTELTNLTLERVRQLVPEVVEKNFAEAARSPAQVRAWIEWYYVKLRPRLNPMSSEDRIFTSMTTRTGLKKSILGVRFQAAVNVGMMHRTIGSYRDWTRKPLQLAN